jgi:succinate dehydrogenase flavin-adding protein (antitoxin of CptAB toxin-antitoxin module)
MATGKELKEISQKRANSAKHLLDAEDWEGAVYMMALSLEIALKAAACKALRLETYPEGQNRDDEYFKTHNLDRLPRVSGCSDIFQVTGNPDAFDNWSLFTGAFVFGSAQHWIAMRYDPKMLAIFTEEKAKELYKALYQDDNSILRAMTGELRW